VPGLQLRAARDDEPAAAAMGVDVARRRLQAWVLSAVLVSISGILLGHFLGAFSPKKFYFIDTFALLAMLIVGGMTTVSGAVGGTVLITIVTEMLRRLEGGGELAGITLPSFFGLTQIGLSAMILLVMYRYRAGLFGLLEWDEAWLRRRAATATIGAGGGAGSDAGGEHGIDAGVASAGSLRADAISKNFSGLQALQQVDLTLAAGEIVGLIGPNGSGKTTLLNILSGGLTASGGVVRIDDHDISRWPSHRIARRGVGRTFQNIRLFKDLSVLENITVGAIAHWPGTSHGSATRQARTLLHSLGLHEFARRPAGTLPYGAQRRLEIARALALRPRYLLLDEPAAGMNPAESTALLNDLRQIRERYGIGLLVVDHDLALIMRLCDRIVVLNEGRLIASGTPAEVQRDAAVIEAYIGRERAGVSSP
jgi:branched-chain amino acid transport system permease protein